MSGAVLSARIECRAAQREWKRVHPFMWVVSAAFVLYFLVPVLQQHVSWLGEHGV